MPDSTCSNSPRLMRQSSSDKAWLIRAWYTVRILCLGFLGALLLRALNMTLRWQREGLAAKEDLWSGSEQKIALFWHGRQLMMPWCYLSSKEHGKRRKLHILISNHRDGRLIAFAMRCLGFHSVAGSSTRGRIAGIQGLLEKLRAGDHIAITPDGPRGPIHRIKVGVIKIAQETGVPIYPMTFAAERYWQFKSWDKMILPKPFSRAVFMMGQPIHIGRDLTRAELQQAARSVEVALATLTETADRYEY